MLSATAYELSGLWTRQRYVRLPPATSTPARRPLVATTSGSGTVTVIAIESGSSDGWSLQGQKRSQPSPCTAVAIHGAPEGVVLQTKPPSHGARFATRGAPAYCTLASTISPGCRVRPSGKRSRPPRRMSTTGAPIDGGRGRGEDGVEVEHEHVGGLHDARAHREVPGDAAGGREDLHGEVVEAHVVGAALVVEGAARIHDREGGGRLGRGGLRRGGSGEGREGGKQDREQGAAHGQKSLAAKIAWARAWRAFLLARVLKVNKTWTIGNPSSNLGITDATVG